MPGKHHDIGLSQLLVAVGKGDREALHRVYLQAGGKLLALAMQVTGTRSGAEDVLQEVFIKIWNRAPGFDPERSDGMAWLTAITRNTSIDWYRAHQRRRLPSDDGAIFLVPDDTELIEDRMIREDLEARAVELLGNLPAVQENEIRQAFFEGLTYAQLAESMGLPLSTVKSRIRRTLQLLRGRIEHD
jgi:RNA polymerase sigma-70 factor (ECF subfamily)